MFNLKLIFLFLATATELAIGMKHRFNSNALVIPRVTNYSREEYMKTDLMVNPDNDWTLYIAVPIALSIFGIVILFFWWAVNDLSFLNSSESFPTEIDYERLNEETFEHDSSDRLNREPPASSSRSQISTTITIH